MEEVYDATMYKCPQCHQTAYQIKDGLTGAGSQRIRCRACDHRYTPTPKPRGYTDEVRQQALKLYVDGLNFRRIARILGVHHQSVINWVKAASAAVPEPLPAPTDADTIELDERYTFVGRKKTGSTS